MNPTQDATLAKSNNTHNVALLRNIRILITITSFTLAAVLMACGAGTQPQSDIIHDKTLVVWAAPADLNQRAGSALTIEDRSDHFDGIIFGELAPAKWMAGSNGFSRTLKDQSGVPAETAAPGEFVQIAIVYHGTQATIYRNGTAISDYQMASPPRDFKSNGFILFGKRHRHATDSAHFAGKIRDARIYDVPLTAQQIAALQPGTRSASVPQPWAWWSFAEGSADKTGRFPLAELTGGAKIEAGSLILDGKEATMMCKTDKEPPFTPETPTLPNPIPSTWLTFHLAHPGPGVGMPGDPNCAFYWKGEYHLHYIYNHEDGFCFAHVSSKDLVHWHWHPTTLTPPVVGHGMFSGTGFFTKDGKPAIIYHGQGSGRNQIQIAEDDQLEKWSKPWPVEPIIQPGQDASLIANWDPDAWLEDDKTYYALSGGSPGSGKPPTLFRSDDLHKWDYLGLFLDHDMPDVQHDEDISCPNFFKIGGKRMLLCISHNKGCRYYIGEWKDERFVPETHHRMNWHGWDFFAPESVLTHDGRRVMWAWCHLEDGFPIQTAVQSLPRELSLPQDGVLRIRPLKELEKLRHDAKSDDHIALTNGSPYVLRDITGDALELKVSFHGGITHSVGLNFYADASGANGFPLVIDAAAKTIRLGETVAPFELKKGEELNLRLFVDKNMIEVFANDRQAVVAACHYRPENQSISLVSQSGSLSASVHAWKMKSIYTNSK